MKLTISEEVKTLWPQTALGVLHYTATVTPSSPELLEAFEAAIRQSAVAYPLDQIAAQHAVAATRKAYRAFGKDPHAYRNAAEAMLRRCAKGQRLYHINNIVEINNLVSISSGCSIGSYDTAQLQGDVVLRVAEEGAHYPGIGKQSVNIGHLPVLFDAQGAFGNPTSDSRRAMIQEGEREILSVLYGFEGTEALTPWLEKFSALLERYGGAKDIQTWTVPAASLDKVAAERVR